MNPQSWPVKSEEEDGHACSQGGNCIPTTNLSRLGSCFTVRPYSRRVQSVCEVKSMRTVLSSAAVIAGVVCLGIAPVKATPLTPVIGNTNIPRCPGRGCRLPATLLPAIWVSGALRILSSSIWLLRASAGVRLPSLKILSAAGRRLCRRSASRRRLRRRSREGLCGRSASRWRLCRRSAPGRLLIQLLQFG